jgi:hypothetical protein
MKPNIQAVFCVINFYWRNIYAKSTAPLSEESEKIQFINLKQVPGAIAGRDEIL